MSAAYHSTPVEISILVKNGAIVDMQDIEVATVLHTRCLILNNPLVKWPWRGRVVDRGDWLGLHARVLKNLGASDSQLDSLKP